MTKREYDNSKRKVKESYTREMKNLKDTLAEIRTGKHDEELGDRPAPSRNERRIAARLKAIREVDYTCPTCGNIVLKVSSWVISKRLPPICKSCNQRGRKIDKS